MLLYSTMPEYGDLFPLRKPPKAKNPQTPRVDYSQERQTMIYIYTSVNTTAPAPGCVSTRRCLPVKRGGGVPHTPAGEGPSCTRVPYPADGTSLGLSCPVWHCTCFAWPRCLSNGRTERGAGDITNTPGFVPFRGPAFHGWGPRVGRVYIGYI